MATAHPSAAFEIRLAQAVEAPALAAFLQLHGDPEMQRSLLYLMHHYHTIFLALNEAKAISGILLSWKSPEVYNTAIVEGIALANDTEDDTTAKLLLDAAMMYWANQCVLQLVAPACEHDPSFDTLLRQAGFTCTEQSGHRQLEKRLRPARICLHQKQMRPRMNTGNGQVDELTLFEYFQDGDTVWGTYSGGTVTRGVLVGKMNANRDIRFHYMQIDQSGQFSEGTSKSSTEFLNDGRIVLYEDWEWTGNRTGSGKSIIEEI